MTIDWKKYYNRSLIFYCNDVLPKDISNFNDREELINQLHRICFSKFAYLLKKDIGKNPIDGDGIVVLSPIQNNTMIQIFDNNEEVFQYSMNTKDVLMLPNYFKINTKPHNAFVKYTFPIKEDLKFGEGSNKYEVSITFSDTYKIIVNAESEEDAINQADLMGIHNFEHSWPENINNEYDRISLTRNTLWNKKMYKVKKI